MLDVWLSSSPFPSSLITNLAEKVFEKLGRDLAIVLGRIFADIVAVSKEEKLRGQSGFRRFGYLRTDPNVPLPSQTVPVSSGCIAVVGDARC